MSCKNLVVRDSHHVLIKDHEIGKLARLDRAFYLFLKHQIRIVDGGGAQGLLAADLLLRPDNFADLCFARDVEIKRDERIIDLTKAVAIAAGPDDQMMIEH